MISNCCAEIVIQSTTYALLAYRDVKRQNLYFSYMFISKPVRIITYSGYKLDKFVSICEVLHITYENWEESYHSNQYTTHWPFLKSRTFLKRMYMLSVPFIVIFPGFSFSKIVPYCCQWVVLSVPVLVSSDKCFIWK